MEKKKNDVIDLRVVFQKIMQQKGLYLRVFAITFVVSSALILCVPRYYVSTVSLAPELDGGSTGSALGSIAASFGFDIGEMQTSDAISPLLYPDLMESNDFVASLVKIPIETKDGSVKTTYFDYIRKHYKKPFWSKATSWVKRTLKKVFSKDPEGNVDQNQIDPFRLTKLQTSIFIRIKKCVLGTVDKKTGVITITVRDQDPLVAALMADSAQSHLQDYIIRYRTNKARVDVEHYTELTQQAMSEYEKSVAAYSKYCDRHMGTVLQAYISERDKLENDMQTKFSTYSAMTTQLETSKAKLQEKTPVFTILQSPSVPVRPAGPKRMLFVLGMLILAGFVLTLYILRDELFAPFK